MQLHGACVMDKKLALLSALGLSIVLSIASSQAHALGKSSTVRSAHDAEKQIVEKTWLLKQMRQLDDDVKSLIAQALRSTFTQTTHTGAKFTYVPRGMVADPILGPGWMDQRGYVWFD